MGLFGKGRGTNHLCEISPPKFPSGCFGPIRNLLWVCVAEAETNTPCKKSHLQFLFGPIRELMWVCVGGAEAQTPCEKSILDSFWLFWSYQRPWDCGGGLDTTQFLRNPSSNLIHSFLFTPTHGASTLPFHSPSEDRK